MSEHEQQPKPPRGLTKRVERLWAAIIEAVSLDARDLAGLVEYVRVVDRLERLDREIRKGGLVLPDGRPNPLLAEARQQQIVMARSAAALRLPEDLREPTRRPQRRSARGAYRPRLSVVREEAL